MTLRLPRLLLDLQHPIKQQNLALPHSPDIYIILGGTNDLFSSTKEKIFKNLQTLYECVLKQPNTKLAMISIPEHPWERKFPEVKEKRIFINSQIENFAVKGGPRTCYINIASVIPQPNPESDENQQQDIAKYWDKDQLHFSPDGYDKIAHLLFLNLSSFW
jgi:lysophospholipase L1-like esterase